MDIISDGHGGLMKVWDKIDTIDPKPFQSTRLMYEGDGDGVAQYPQAKTAIQYARQAGFKVFEGNEIVADRNDMPGSTYTLQRLRNGKWVWNRK